MIDQVFDAVVIGSGAGGGFAAMALAEGGMRVLLLERGPQYVPARDFPMNHDDWELRGEAFLETAHGREPTLALESGPPIPAEHRHLCSRDLRTQRVSGCGRRGPFRYLRAIGLGGSTLHYQGEAHRFPDFAFRPHSNYGHGDADWPVSYSDLEPYYARAEGVLGVAGEPGNPFKPSRGPFPTPAHSLSTASQYVARGAARLGWTVLPNSLAIPSRPYEGRPACRASGGCVEGCMFGAKSSVDLTALAHAERSGRLTLVTGARAVSLDSDPSGKVERVLFLRDGQRHEARGRFFVLAAGAIETPRLLLLSASTRQPGGLANSSGLVGRYLMETLFAGLVVVADRDLRSYRGQQLNARLWDFARPDGTRGLRSGFVLGVTGTHVHHGPVSYAEQLGGIGLDHKRAVRERFGRVITLFGIAEHEPRQGNRIELHALTDDDGIPRVRVHSDFSDADRTVLRAMIEKLEAWADACGVSERVNLITTYGHPSAAQIGGTCRMGRDPAKSVTDAYGRCHDLSNLYIADASLLVSQGAGDSPSLTIQALALRTAERILANQRAADKRPA